MSDITALWQEILDVAQGKTVAVIGHHRPDGDCIGSTIALTRMLRQKGIEATAVNLDECPDYIDFLLGDTPCSFGEEALSVKADLVITVDCAAHDRLGKEGQVLFSQIDFNIDHHISNTLFGKRNLVVADAAATCEILATIAQDNDLSFDHTLLQALYVGIITDTGQFQYGATSAHTLQIASWLLSSGIRPDVISNTLYANQTFASLQLLQRFLSTLQTELDGQFCYGWTTNEDFLETNATREDSEGLVNYTRSLKGVKVGAYVEERETAIKVSLRAQYPQFAVHKIAEHFGGGGHPCAAGYSSEASLEETKQALAQFVATHLRSIEA